MKLLRLISAGLLLVTISPLLRAYDVQVTGTASGAVWGSGPYTDDSTIGVAAVHAGLIAIGQTATIRVTPLGTQNYFPGSTRNGVTTYDWFADWGAISLSLVGGNTPASVSHSAPSVVHVGESFTVSASCSDPDGNLMSLGVRWQGIGIVDSWSVSGSSASRSTTLTAPSSATTIRVRAEALDTLNAGGDSGWQDIQVIEYPPANHAPAISLSFLPGTNVPVSSSLQITASASDSDGNLMSMGIRWQGYGLRPGPWDVTGYSASRSTTETMPSSAGTQYFRGEVWDQASSAIAADWQSVNVYSTASPSLTVSPATPVQGQTITVNYSQAPDSTTWIGLHAVGASDYSPVTYAYVPGVGSGTVTFTISASFAVGTAYEARMHPSDGYTTIATSNSFVPASTNPTYSLTVTGGTGGGVGLSTGTVRTITATPAAGQTFLRWEFVGAGNGTLGNAYSAITTFTIGTSNATVQAIYDTPTSYTLTMVGGVASPAGPQATGTQVTVTATPGSGQAFSSWNQTGVGSLASATQATTTFTFGAGNTTLQANFVSSDSQAPTSPTNLVSSNITSTSVTLSWSAATDNVGVTGYQVIKDGTPLSGTVTGTSTTVSGLTAGTTYQFQMRATDAGGNWSQASSAISVATAAVAPVRVALQFWQAYDYPWYDNGYYDYDENGDEYWVSDYLEDGLSGSSWTTNTGTYNINSAASGYAAANASRGTVAATYQRYNYIYFRTWGQAPGGNCNSYQAKLYHPNGTLLTQGSFTSSYQWETQFYAYDCGLYRVDITYLNATNGANPASGTATYYFQVGTLQSQTITFPTIADQPSNTAPFTLGATASSGLPVSYTVVSGPATVSGNTLTLTGDPGMVTVRASQLGGTNGSTGWSPATPVDRTFAVTYQPSNPGPDTQAPVPSANFTVGTVTYSTVALSWTAATDNVGVTGYRIVQNGVAVGTTITGLSTTVSGLSAETTYQFAVQARDGAGNWSVPSIARTVTTPVLPPIRVALQYWRQGDYPYYEDGYWEEDEDGNWWFYGDYYDDGYYGSTWTTSTGTYNIGDAGSGYSAANVSRGMALYNYSRYSQVYFRAWGYAPYGNCNSYQARVYSPTGSLLQQSGIFSSYSGFDSSFYAPDCGIYRVEVSYQNATGGANPANAAVSYYFQVGPVQSQTITFPTITDQPANMTALVLGATASSGLPITYSLISGPATLNGNTLTFTGELGTVVVRASQAGGTTGASGWLPATSVDRTIVVINPDTQAPVPPANVTVGTVTTSTVALSWTAATDNVGVTGYRVVQNGTPVGPTITGLSTTVAGLASGSTYQFAIQARDGVGNWSASSVAQTATTLATPPIRLALQYWREGDHPYYEDGYWEEDEDGNWWFYGDYYEDGYYGSTWTTSTGTYNINDAGSGYSTVNANRGATIYSYSGYSYIYFRAWGYAPYGNCNSYQARVYSPSGSLLQQYGGNYSFDGYFYASENGAYRVEVSYLNATNGANPANATVTYYFPVGPLPSITTQPTSQTVNAGTNVTFTVAASGSGLSYQWKKNGSALANGGNVSGATTASLTLSNVQTADAGSFSVTVTNTSGSATSNAATLTVSGSAPTITTQPTSQAVNAGANVTFTVAASGSGLSYQWKKNGSALANGGNVSGATTATLTLSNVQTADAGSYSVTVTNTSGSAISNTATLTINAGSGPPDADGDGVPDAVETLLGTSNSTANAPDNGNTTQLKVQRPPQ